MKVLIVKKIIKAQNQEVKKKGTISQSQQRIYKQQKQKKLKKK